MNSPVHSLIPALDKHVFINCYLLNMGKYWGLEQRMMQIGNVLMKLPQAFKDRDRGAFITLLTTCDRGLSSSLQGCGGLDGGA